MGRTLKWRLNLPEDNNEKETIDTTLDETPTQSPEMVALETKLAGLQVELEQTKKGLSTAHQTLTRKDEELKHRADLENRIDGLQDTMEILATAISARGEVEEFGSEKRQDILAELKKRRNEQDAKTKQKELLDTQQEYARKADALYARAKAAFGNDDDAIERIEDLLGSGRLERAEARVMKAEQKTNPPKDNGKETEDQRIERLAEEKLRRHLEERGLLETYGVTSSGSGTAQEAMGLYVKGKITAEEAQKRGVTF